MNFFDSHTHLNDVSIYDKREEYLNDFLNIWWKWLIIPWVDEFRNERGISVCKEFADKVLIGCNIGFHPSEVCEWKIFEKDILSKLDYLKTLYKQNKDTIVWIWECGIDLHYDWAQETIFVQKQLFDMQCAFAQEQNLPVVIHSRDDFNSTMDVLKNYKNSLIYFHCYGYWADEIKYIQNNFSNFYIWFAWNVTYPKAFPLRDALSQLDLTNILLETDAPYLAPQKLRWTINYPANVKHIYDFVSDYLKIEPEVLSAQLGKNFMKLFFKKI